MKLRITVLPGDGVGPEVTREAVKVLRAVRDCAGCDIEFSEALIGGIAVRQTGTPLPPATLDACQASSAVLLGAVGSPEFDNAPAHQRPEKGLLELRQALGGFANLRPARAWEPLASCSPFRAEVVKDVDILVVRELLGGLYFGEPRGYSQNGHRSGYNTMRYSEPEIERIAEIAFTAARHRRRKVTSVDKANVLETSRLWREVVTRVGRRYPDVALDHVYVDACAMYLCTTPRRFDVLLTENLFGDILSDQAASLSGSLGMVPSATIGGAIDLYEPVHGSAPDIAGKNKANPLGAILSAALLLRHTAKLEREANIIETAVDAALRSGYRTADIAQPGATTVSTSEMGDLIERTVTDQLYAQHAFHAV